MSFEYLSPSGKKFSIDYQELKEKYQELDALSGSEFKARLPEILHFCCIVGWFKGLSNNQLISDEGLIHELVHLLTIPDEPLIDFSKIRHQFSTFMKLS